MKERAQQNGGVAENEPKTSKTATVRKRVKNRKRKRRKNPMASFHIGVYI